ncbi:MAG: hypothetical protein E6772_08015 [Dysgonomonas sp.]|nr:hypothetical protein [Dysgonomonas sp.]
MRKLHFLIASFLFVLVSVNLKAQSPCVMNYESNETIDDAWWLNGLDWAYGSVTIQGGISSSSDVDFYRVQITHPGSRLRLTLRNLPKSYGMIVYYKTGYMEEPLLIDYNLNYGTSDKIIDIPTCNSGGMYVKIFSPFGEYDENNCYTLTADVLAR